MFNLQYNINVENGRFLEKTDNKFFPNESEKFLSIDENDKKNRLLRRSDIELLQSSMINEFGEEAFKTVEKMNENGLREFFVGESYIRRLFLPAGKIIVSKLWKKDRLWIIPFGDVTISHELGIERITGPYEGKAPYGSKVVIHSNKDTLWYAITGAKSTNNKDVEKEVTTETYETLEWSEI